jgi:hypothetical protein
MSRPRELVRNADGFLPVTACSWRVGPPTFSPPGGWRAVTISEAIQRDNTILYAVRCGGWVANADGDLECEPIPSSRDDDFIARCRFADWEQAFLVAQKLAAQQRREMEVQASS